MSDSDLSFLRNSAEGSLSFTAVGGGGSSSSYSSSLGSNNNSSVHDMLEAGAADTLNVSAASEQSRQRHRTESDEYLFCELLLPVHENACRSAIGWRLTIALSSLRPRLTVMHNRTIRFHRHAHALPHPSSPSSLSLSLFLHDD